MEHLYEITMAQRQVMSILHEMDSSDESASAYVDTLEALDVAFKDKLEACYMFIQEQKSKAEMHREESKKQLEWAEQLDKKAERTADYILRCMNEINTKNVETEHYRFTAKTSGTRSVAIDVPIEKLPKEYITWSEPKASANKKEIAKMLKEQGVDSCEFAHLEAPKVSLIAK